MNRLEFQINQYPTRKRGDGAGESH